MALLLNDKRYLVLKENGEFEIYPSKLERDKVKNSTNPEIIIKKYQEILDSLNNDDERQYYDSDKWYEEYSGWQNEYNKYTYDLWNIKKGGTDYPLMEKYFPDVKNTVPNIIESGVVCYSNETKYDEYQLAKERVWWGETEDC